MPHQLTNSRFKALIILLACSGFSVGCTATGEGMMLTGKNAYQPTSTSSHTAGQSKRRNVNSATGRSQLVALDLVSALVQVESLDPVTTMLNMERPSSRYGTVLAEQLQSAGYVVRKGAQPGTPGFLQYSIKSVAHIDGPAYEFGLSVDGVKLRRQYRLKGDSIVPASSMFVFGASPDGIEIDDAIFNTDELEADADSAANPDTSADAYPNANLEANLDAGITVAGAAASNRVDASAELTAEPVEPVVDITAVKPRELHNMFETRESNYSALLKRYSDVEQIVLVFDNDSITMGQRNKRLTRELVAQYDEQTDLLSVIGCSHGNTAVEGKNRALALGRSLRVKEELVLAGINPGHVLDEGCWDSNHFDEMMPRRGVVLTLKREQAATQ